MADENQLTKIEERLTRLEVEVDALRQNRSRTGRQRTARPKDRKSEVISSNAFERPGVIPPSTQDRPDSIVGGTPTTDFPDCCAIGDDEGFYCSGTLIAPNLVVTAGHCTGVKRVFLRGSDVRDLEEGEVINVNKEFNHANADIRLLVLENPSTVTPRHIAQGLEIGSPKTARLVGFGNVNLAGTIGYGVKRMVEVPITSLGCETATEAGEFGCTQGKEMVAGHRGLLKDSCHGDSGGPLYIKRADGGYALLGATSRGIGNTEHACGDGGIYVRVDQFLDWIREKTGVSVEGPLT